MFSSPPVITDVGMTLLLRAAGGEKITFTKFQAGNGFWTASQDPKKVTALKNVVIGNIPITKAEATEDDGYVQLEASFDNQTDIQTDFLWTELGLIAEDEEENEYLYAYGYDGEYAETIKAGGSAVMLEQYISAIIAIGDSENITVNVLPNATYASRQDFLDHVNNHNNPHEVSLQQLGAAAATHTHSASDIISGLLPLSHGGTGVGTLPELKALIGSEFVMGIFSGDGQKRHDIELGFKPDRVWLIRLATGNVNQSAYVWSFSPQHNIYHSGCNISYFSCDADTLFQIGHGGAAVTDTGFAVGYYKATPDTTSNTEMLNVKNKTYGFIAGKIGEYNEEA